jgi:hypothetical protein
MLQRAADKKKETVAFDVKKISDIAHDLDIFGSAPDPAFYGILSFAEMGA